ncbi:hypothetical protein QLS71_002735 [Mariniflexile litorale]|uniref:Uncharacterized protein n=1 Tax=Mariniflexile litorale TaxID=3045158 RepID=A0AAU7EHC4_9FLAO|nr:hypothetical protein [Mariniflexile sp. KMM 9835]MDQ8209935.1 hypothetical protein [Mariniflexile sp. KMM 9835]
MKLDFLESAVLKTLVLDYSEPDIQKLLEIDHEKYHLIISNLFFKYNTYDLFQTILFAIANGHINRYDLVKDEIKNLALSHSQYIYDNLKILDLLKIKSSNDLDGLLNEFIIKSQGIFIKKDCSKISFVLSLEEIEYCKHRVFHSLRCDLSEFDESILTNFKIEKALIRRLKVNNFFNVIRRVFELQLIEKDIFVPEYEDLQKAIKEEVKINIISNYQALDMTDKEKRLSIYFNLINYYNELENKLFFAECVLI